MWPNRRDGCIAGFFILTNQALKHCTERRLKSDELTLQAGQMFVIPRGIGHRSMPGKTDMGNVVLELKVSVNFTL
jgi:hypothetical protein